MLTVKFYDDNCELFKITEYVSCEDFYEDYCDAYPWYTIDYWEVEED